MGWKSTHAEPAAPRRYLGLELSGAKNPKTALSALEYYPREKKIFLLDVYDRVVPLGHETSDNALLGLIGELRVGVSRMGVNVPLSLPPCFLCTPRICKKPAECSSVDSKWMRDYVKRTARAAQAKGIRSLPITPYTQRPIELFVRYSILPKIPENLRFEIDETLGGNRAPLTARMHFLKRALEDFQLVEVWPKLSVSLFADPLKLSKRVLQNYRQLESGVDARTEILEHISERQGVFIYDRDLKKLSASLAAFDSFICAYTALLVDLGLCQKSPAGFPKKSGWIAIPNSAGLGLRAEGPRSGEVLA